MFALEGRKLNKALLNSILLMCFYDAHFKMGIFKVTRIVEILAISIFLDAITNIFPAFSNSQKKRIS